MASPSTVITLGYGGFGSVNLLPTLGYGIGAAVVLVLAQPSLDHGWVAWPGVDEGVVHLGGPVKGWEA